MLKLRFKKKFEPKSGYKVFKSFQTTITHKKNP